MRMIRPICSSIGGRGILKEIRALGAAIVAAAVPRAAAAARAPQYADLPVFTLRFGLIAAFRPTILQAACSRGCTCRSPLHSLSRNAQVI